MQNTHSRVFTPITRMILNVATQHCCEGAVDLVCLSIRLSVIGGRESIVNVQHLADTLEEFGLKLGAVVRRQHLGWSKLEHPLIHKGKSDVVRSDSLERLSLSQLREPVRYKKMNKNHFLLFGNGPSMSMTAVSKGIAVPWKAISKNGQLLPTH